MNMIALASEVSGLGSEQPLESAAVNRLAELHVPTLIIIGSLDQPAVIEMADQLEKGILGAQKVIMSGAAHLPNMERPAEFNHLVLEFLGRL